MLRRVLDAYNGASQPTSTSSLPTRAKRTAGPRLRPPMLCRVGRADRWVEYHDASPVDGARWTTTLPRATAPPPSRRCWIAKATGLMVRMRFCTQELKLRPMREFMRAQGYGDDWTNIVGLRWDEPQRVSPCAPVTPRGMWVVPAVRRAREKGPTMLAWWKAQPSTCKRLRTWATASAASSRAAASATAPRAGARGLGAVGITSAWPGALHFGEPEGYMGSFARVSPARAAIRRRDRGHIAPLRLHPAPPSLRTCTCGARRGKATPCCAAAGAITRRVLRPAPGTDDGARIPLNHETL